MKQICFRFDVDTHKCAKIGMPRLLDLGKRKGIKFTFFINCGRAISLRHSLLGLVSRGPAVPADLHPHLGARRKFGNLEFFRCALMNPRILECATDVVRQAQIEGHEIGLHGGRNHELWGRLVHSWSEERIADEIRWGVAQLKTLGIEPRIFASPCAAGGERVNHVLGAMRNFKYVSDNLSSAGLPEISRGILDVPTNICGTGGVAYIEQLVALGRTPAEIILHFKERLEILDFGVFYDHPYFAGCEALDIMEGIIDVALEARVKVVTLSAIGATYESHLSSQGA